MLGGIKLAKSAMKSVNTLNAPAQLFAVHMQPLSAGKIQEKIKQDVVNRFKDNLYKEKLILILNCLKMFPSLRRAQQLQSLKMNRI